MAAFIHVSRFPAGARQFLIAQAHSRQLSTAAARVRAQVRSGHVGFVVDKVALGQVFSEYFGFPCQFSFHRLLHTHHLSSGAGTIGQVVADVPSGLSLTPPQETKILTTSIIRYFSILLHRGSYRFKLNSIPSVMQQSESFLKIH
jgi:hypothetical protein